jgi:hypothetical protein
MITSSGTADKSHLLMSIGRFGKRGKEFPAVNR